ncbi:hypothetical protein FHQ08_10620 [Lactobacillus sp. CC-MHH1034]|nr:hypothetical protein [Agrilactobacillus fermenti]
MPLTIPSDYYLVETTKQTRNGKTVTVLRYQNNPNIVMNNAHLTVILAETGQLLSYNDFSGIPDGNLVRSKTARQVAEKTFQRVDPNYAAGLAFMRIDHYERHFFDADDSLQMIPISWVKFAHQNGSYNWVSVGGNGTVVEYEIDSRWDYFAARRATEEWNYDDWVLARQGKGPQLSAPQALA